MGGRGRAPCCDKSQVKRGPWSPAEDLRLISFIQKHGHANWRSLPKQAGLARCGKSCRLRWINYLRPDLKRGNFTKEEDESIIKLQETYGNKWSKIASHFPGRTDNEIKNVWNTHQKKRSPSKNSKGDDQSKELSSITNSYSSSSSSYIATFHLPSKESNAEAKARLENHSNQEKLDQKTMVEEIEDQVRVDDTACMQKLTMNYEPQIAEKEVFEIPLEFDYDFWNMLDGTVVPFKGNTEPLLLPHQEDHTYHNPKLDMVESDEKWLSYLDIELGLDGLSTKSEMNGQDLSMRATVQLGQEKNCEELPKHAEMDLRGMDEWMTTTSDRDVIELVKYNP